MLISRNIVVGNRGYNVQVPDECPVCHRHSEVQFIQAEATNDNTEVQAVWKCAFQGCKSYFLCYYGPVGTYELRGVKPRTPKSSLFSEAINTVSPTFVDVFREAEEAAQAGLAQIAGPGYRKAFEFLIKDYAKTLAPARKDEIESKFSGAVVNDFIADARIQAVAKRSLWLGNDETHYLRKWTDHDLTDLVALIRLTAHWIEIEHLSKGYIDSMPG